MSHIVLINGYPVKFHPVNAALMFEICHEDEATCFPSAEVALASARAFRIEKPTVKQFGEFLNPRQEYWSELLAHA